MAQGSTLLRRPRNIGGAAGAGRGVLFMETLNERGNTYVAQSRQDGAGMF